VRKLRQFETFWKRPIEVKKGRTPHLEEHWGKMCTLPIDDTSDFGGVFWINEDIIYMQVWTPQHRLVDRFNPREYIIVYFHVRIKCLGLGGYGILIQSRPAQKSLKSRRGPQLNDGLFFTFCISSKIILNRLP
jgi:hypothetical protein